MPELQIIDQELFDQAQEIVTQRKTKNAEWRNIPRQNGNGALLGGNLYCATCGRRMTSRNPGKGAKRDKAEYRKGLFKTYLLVYIQHYWLAAQPCKTFVLPVTL